MPASPEAIATGFRARHQAVVPRNDRTQVSNSAHMIGFIESVCWWSHIPDQLYVQRRSLDPHNLDAAAGRDIGPGNPPHGIIDM
jgi:hypothetical protein